MPDDDKAATAATGAAATTTTTDDKPEVSFKTRAEFHAEIARKTKGEVAKAVEAAKAELFGQLGIESPDELPAFKEKLAATAKTVSEAEKLKNAHDKLDKELKKAIARGDSLTGKLQGIAKRDALAPYAARVVDPQILAMLADSHLEVDEDGAVSVKDGGKLDDLVEGFLKAKPYLKNPAHKDGAGTTAQEPKAKAGDAAKDATAAGDDAAKAKDANGTQYPSMGHKIMAELAARNALPKMGP